METLAMTVTELIAILLKYPAHYRVKLMAGYTCEECEIQSFVDVPEKAAVEIYTDRDELLVEAPLRFYSRN
jgi:hypothetical protein